MDLFLSDSLLVSDGNDTSLEKRKSLLHDLESDLWPLMTAGGRSEVRLWLCNTIAGITSIAPNHQRDLFLKLLDKSGQKKHVASQLLELVFEKKPRKAGPILAKKSFMLERFFKENSSRILAWFSNFAGSSTMEHRKGAKTLSQYAFKNRDVCWEELEWRGKHGQSPAMVATKPHYFLDLDVQKTVENFLEYVPEFWSSSEFSESLKDGEILHVDKAFFVDMFLDLMYKEDMKELWKIIDDYLYEESFSLLCHHLLIILKEPDLLYFLNSMHKYLKPRLDVNAHGNPSSWVEVILSECSIISLDHLFLLNGATCKARQLLRLVREEGNESEKERIRNVVFQLCASSGLAGNLSPIIIEWSKTRNLESVKWLGLQSWAIFFRLSEEVQNSESWESLFASNGIGFRKSGNYELLDIDEDSEESKSDCSDRSLVKHKHKKRRRQSNKRRRKLLSRESWNDGVLDLDSSPSAGAWLLSTDNYSTTWSNVDLPEHVSKHCFYTWIKLAAEVARDT